MTRIQNFKIADDKGDQNSKTTIVVALIGFAGIVTVALIENWDKSVSNRT